MKRYTYYICAFVLLPLLWGCESHSESSSAMGDLFYGQGGSMACFAISGDYLYAVDRSRLMTFDISAPEAPEHLKDRTQFMDFGVETLFPMDTLLFMGSQTGMYVYSIAQPEFPQQLAYVSHITACDPVVASEEFAYVTLNSESARCGRAVNELHIYDLSDIRSPRLVHAVSDFRHPKGLGIDGGKLFVCDGILKVFDLSDPVRPVRIDDTSDIPEAAGADAYDVIPLNGLLLMTGADGLYQFDYTGPALSFVSKIDVSPEK